MWAHIEAPVSQRWPKAVAEKPWRETVALLAISVTATLQTIDPGITVLALPDAATELGLIGGQQDFLRSISALVLAACMLGVGILGDRYGRKRLLVWGAVGMGVAAVICAVAPNALVFGAGRMLMGLATALAFSMSIAMVPTLFAKVDLPRIFGIQLAIMSGGYILATLAGGWLIDAAGWRASFLVTAAFSLGCAVAAAVFAPESRGELSGRLDLLGILLAAVAMTTLVYGVSQVGEQGWLSALVLGCIGASIVCFVVFAIWELKARDAGFPIRLFTNRTFLSAALVGAMFNFANGGLTGQIPRVLGAVGHPAIVKSVMLGIMGVGMLVGAMAAGQACGKYGVTARTMFISGMLILAAGFATQVFVPWLSTAVMIGVGCFIVGFGIMWSQNLEAAVILGTAPPDLVGTVGAVKPAVGQLGMGFGLAVIGPAMARMIPEESATAVVSAYATVMAWAAAAFVLTAVLIAVIMPRPSMQ